MSEPAGVATVIAVHGGDPNADYGELWAAVHDYLVCQTRSDEQAGADLSRAYTRLVEAHNLIHGRYVVEQPLEIAGAPFGGLPGSDGASTL